MIGTIGVDVDMNKKVGHLKWIPHETESIKVLIIYKKYEDVVVLIRRATIMRFKV